MTGWRRVGAVAFGLALGLGACSPTADDVVRNLASDNPVVREDTAKLARNVGGEEVVGALIASLGDESELVRLHAVDSLAELEAAEAVTPLIGVVQGDASAEVRRQAIDALGRLGDPVAVPTILEYLQADGHERPPLNAVWALGAIGDMSAMPALIEFRGSADPYVAYNVDRALRELRP